METLQITLLRIKDGLIKYKAFFNNGVAVAKTLSKAKTKINFSLQ